MKTKILITAVIVSSFVIRHPSFAQGSLTPPGAPAPTMITLSQIEPRTPISSAPFTISQPGAYYLTTNLVSGFSDAILIATNHVTLDLNGFTISTSEAGYAGTGILLSGPNMNIAIYNGHIISGVTNNGSGVYTGNGFFNGIYFIGPTPQNVRVSDLTVWGTAYYGINVGAGNATLVENCHVHTIGSQGIIGSTVKSSSATDVGSTAIACDQAEDCRGQSTVNGQGIACNNAQNCTGFGNGGGGHGINANYTALNCYGSASYTGIGIYATTVENSYGSTVSGAAGIEATTVNNSYGYCPGGSGGHGIYASAVTGSEGDTYGSGDGINCTLAQSSRGYSSSAGNGITAYGNAMNCYGSTAGGYGILASDTAESCYGQSTSGVGLAADVAAFCTGSRSGGRAIQATIGNSCFAASGTNFISLKYNMP